MTDEMEIGLRFRVDQQSREQVKRAAAELKQELSGTASATKGIEDALKSLQRQKQLDALASDAAKSAAQSQNAAEAVGFLNRQLRLVGATESEIKRVASQFERVSDEIERANQQAERFSRQDFTARTAQSQGDLSSGLSAIGQVAGGLGLSTGGVQFGADIAGALEYLPRLRESVSALGQAAANSGGVVGSLASSATSLVPALGAAGGGLAGLVAVAAPFAIAAAGIALAVQGINAAFEAGKQAIDEFLAVERTQLDTRLQNVAELRTLTTEEARARQADLQQQVAILNAELEARKLQRAEIARQYEALGASFDPLNRAVLRQAGQQFDADITALQDQLDSLNASLENTTNVLIPGVAAREREAAAAQKTGTSEADLTKTRELASRNLQSLIDQQNRLNAAYTEQAQTTAEDRLIRDRREQEDFNRARQQSAQVQSTRLLAIEQQSAGRIAQLREQGVKRLADADKQITDARGQLGGIGTKLAADSLKARQEYFTSERAATQKFLDAEKKAGEEANKERIRRLEDLSNELLDAEQANDVVRFIAAKRRGQQDLKRLSEDRDEQTQERQRQFDEERQQAQAQFQERLAALQVEADARRADLQAQIQERLAAREQLRQDILKDVEQERKAAAERKKEAQAAYEEQLKREDENRKLRLQRQKEDDATADKRRKEQLDAQLRDLQTKADAERQIIQGTVGVMSAAFGGLAQGVANQARSTMSAIQQTAANFGGLTSRSTPLPAQRVGGLTRIAFAEGGVATRPTLGLLGERPGYHEAMIPFRQSEGLGAALARYGVSSPTINWNGTIIVGEVASPSDVQRMLRTELQAAGAAIVKGLAAARAG